MAWYWWLILGILVGWIAEWLFEIICWRSRRRRSYEVRIEELEGSLDECHRGVVHLRGELEQRDLRIVDLQKDFSARLEAPAVATITPGAKLADVGLAAPDLRMKAPDIDLAAPDLRVDVPDIDLAVPDLHVAAPGIDLAASDLHVAAPGIDLAAPDLHVAALGIDLAAPDLHVAAPGIDLAAPDLHVAAPDIDLTAPDLHVTEGIPAQDLAAIRNIGPVFEQKLYEAGVGTYAQLAALSDVDVKDIIQPAEWQDFDYESWNEQSQRLAVETDTVGAIWNGIIPDDLSKIKGIGQVAEQKLHGAGIMTFADLAAASVAQLEAIVQPQAWQNVDMAGWIAQAADLA